MSMYAARSRTGYTSMSGFRCGSGTGAVSGHGSGSGCGFSPPNSAKLCVVTCIWIHRVGLSAQL